jgi:alpha-amylase/alpha-mannosidase (GH57 family)
MLFRIREASSKISFGTEQTYWHLIEREVAGARWMFQQAHRYDAAIPPLLRLYGWDGENQAYNFQDFRWGDTLHLHELLTGAQEFHVELPGEFVARFPDPLCPVLDDFVPGSWGDEADCRVWVGGEAHNAVFRILKDVRARLEEAQAHGHPNHGGSRAQTLALAWKEFHAACGSDFLWVISQRGGYGAVPVPLFSEIFVRKLTSALKLAGAKTPKSLLEFSRKTGYEDPLFTPPQRR